MSKKKVAPYSPRKLGELLCDYIVQGGFENSAKLDYFSPSYDDETEIKKETFEIYSITDFGSNEGIYTSFYRKAHTFDVCQNFGRVKGRLCKYAHNGSQHLLFFYQIRK